MTFNPQTGMTDYNGMDLYAEINEVPINADYRSFEVTRRINDADASAGGDEYESFLFTRKRIEGSFEVVEQIGAGTAGSPVREQLREGVDGTLTFGPEGTLSGRPKYQLFVGFLESAITYTADDVQIRRVRWRNKHADGWILDYEDPTKRSVWA